MKSLQDRAIAFSNQFGYEKSLEFKAKVRRDKKLGRRAARKMGKTGYAIHDYADVIMRANISGGPGTVFQKLKDDFHAHGVNMSDRQIQKFIDDTLHEAKMELLHH